MNRTRALFPLLLFVCIASGSASAKELPICSNRTINEVTSRVGCTVGDSRCWFAKGGFCTDYVRQKLVSGKADTETSWAPVQPEDVQKGDIATFNSPSHYAYVENVIRDKKGKPLAVDVSEYNYGDCLVDEETMVTDKYKRVNRRSAITLDRVDGGFIRYIP